MYSLIILLMMVGYFHPPEIYMKNSNFTATITSMPNIIMVGLVLWCLMPLFNNISVISWRSVLLVEETGVPG